MLKIEETTYRVSGLEVVVEGLDSQEMISGSIILSPWNKARFLIFGFCRSQGV